MSTSLVIAAFDEGPDLEATVALARASEPAPSEIIVVDDCSQEPVEGRLRAFPDVVVVRTPSRLGAGPSKAYGGLMATGDLIVLMDAHLRFSQDWLRIALDAHSRFPSSILCPVSTGFRQNDTFNGAGARFTRRGDLALDLDWLGARDRDMVDLVPAVLGGCYFIPKNIWSVLGGFNPCLSGWGYEEQDLSIRAWLSGFDCRCINGLLVQHNYDRNLTKCGDRLASWHGVFNGLVVAATVFEDGVFEKSFAPFARFMSPHGAEALQQLNKISSRLKEFRSKVQTDRVFDDSELCGLTGIRIPTRDSFLWAKDEQKIRTASRQEVKEQERQERVSADAKIHERMVRHSDCLETD